MRVLPLRENAWLVSSLRETCRIRVLVGCVGFWVRSCLWRSTDVPVPLYFVDCNIEISPSGQSYYDILLTL